MASTSRLPFSDQRRNDHRDNGSMDNDTFESDTEYAFQLQLQEALTASLATQPFSSSARNDAASVFVPMEQTIKVLGVDLARAIHDAKVGREITEIPDDEWERSGAGFNKAFDAGASSSAAAASIVESEFRLYFMGLLSEEHAFFHPFDPKLALAGIGVAICDSMDNLVFEVSKPLIENKLTRNMAQLEALIEGLNAALSLGLKRITFFCDNYSIFHFINGKWSAKEKKVLNLVNQVKSLQNKFTECNSILVPWLEIKFAFKLARDAIESQLQMKPAEPIISDILKETCVICMEDCDVGHMFSVVGCLHRYCFSCMKQHVEVKLLNGILPKCPHEDCKSDLNVDSCAKFLSVKHVDTMRQRIKEASIPATERIYCPYPRCSLLMSKSELYQHAKETLMGAVENSGLRICINCRNPICINCKVPWHISITCADYKRLNPNPPEEDTKLKFLASSKLWRQCVKCSHMIELLEGCYHMTCRCNYEFCYNCGAEWKNKKPTCKCPLWHEDHILHNEDGFILDDEDGDFDEVEANENNILHHEDGFIVENEEANEDNILPNENGFILNDEDGDFDEVEGDEDNILHDENGFILDDEDGDFDEVEGDEDNILHDVDGFILDDENGDFDEVEGDEDNILHDEDGFTLDDEDGDFDEVEGDEDNILHDEDGFTLDDENGDFDEVEGDEDNILHDEDGFILDDDFDEVHDDDGFILDDEDDGFDEVEADFDSHDD